MENEWYRKKKTTGKSDSQSRLEQIMSTAELRKSRRSISFILNYCNFIVNNTKSDQLVTSNERMYR